MKKQIAIVVSQFNHDITEKLLLKTRDAFLKEHHFEESQLKIVSVPGAIEIPLIAKLLAKTKKYHAIVTLGAVIRGETTHYDYVCDQVSRGCQNVMLEQEIPVIFGVLTTENEDQAYARIDEKSGDFAKAAMQMIALVEQTR